MVEPGGPVIAMACDLLDVDDDVARRFVADGGRPFVQEHCHACLKAADRFGLVAG
jgi:hypothetical protein